MMHKHIEGTGNKNLPKPTTPIGGLRILQNTPTQEKLNRIRIIKSRPQKPAPTVDTVVCETEITAPPADEDLHVVTLTGDSDVLGIIKLKTTPSVKCPAISILPKSEYLTEQFVPDEEETTQITKKKTQPSPVAPVQPPKPDPTPPPKPEEPKK